MSRATPVLFIAVMALSMAVIYVRHQHRMVFADIQKSERQSAALARQKERLLLEQQSWLGFGRVEKLAKQKLHMEKPDMATVRIITLDKH